MDLPSTRELELESLLREKEEQIIELGDEVTRLRQYLSTQPGPSTTDPVTLPPPLVSFLLPHLHTNIHLSTPQPQLEVSQTTQTQTQAANSQASGYQITSGTGASISASSATAPSTMHTALTQRVKLLQEENDEMYEILKQSETGRLKEEVQSLRRIVEKLEGALRESHSVISLLSTELDKSYESFVTSKQNSYNSSKGSFPDSRSPRTNSHSNHHNTGSSGASNGNSSGKLPPTGPRAHKKPRLSESTPHHNSHSRSSPSISPHLRNNTALPSQSQSYQSIGGQHHHHHQRSRSNSSRHREPREHSEHSSPRNTGKGNQNHVKSEKMEVDEDGKMNRVRSPEQRRDGVGHRDRGREREKNHRGRDKERDTSRRNGNSGRMGGGGGGGRKGEKMMSTEEDGGFGNNADRTLAERMGL